MNHRPRTSLDNIRLSRFLQSRGSAVNTRYPGDSKASFELDPDIAFGPHVTHFMTLLGVSADHYARFQRDFPHKQRLLNFYSKGITPGQKVCEVIAEAGRMARHRHPDWDIEHVLDFDNIESFVRAAPLEQNATCNLIFELITGYDLQGFFLAGANYDFRRPGKLPDNLDNFSVNADGHIQCPYDHIFYPPEMFGYRFAAFCEEVVEVHTYGNPPEQDTVDHFIGHFSTLEQALQAAYQSRIPNAYSLHIHYKHFTLLSAGVEASGISEWTRIKRRQYGAQDDMPLPISDELMDNTIYAVEKQLFGEIRSAEHFLAQDLGL
jgi:hypothetical protein